MDYIDVVSRFNYPKSGLDGGPIPLIVEQSDGVLTSLVNVCTKVRLKPDLKFYPEKIKAFKQSYLDDTKCSLWIDSGGFNFLDKWEMCVELLDIYLNHYIDFISTNQSYDKVFSLDFPLVKTEVKKKKKKNPTTPKKVKVKKQQFDNSWFNTEAIVRKWNFESQRRSVKAISENPSLKDKYVYVYQFRTPTLYKMWTELYKELDLGSHIRHRAIGGLVGIHNASSKETGHKLLFSPVIGPAYKCLYDYLDAGDFTNDFTLHFLGISNKIDQFTIILLEQLFTQYLSDLGQDKVAKFSVDTRYHSTKMDKKLRSEGIFSFDKEKYHTKIHRDYDIRLVDSSRLGKTYGDHRNEISEEINEVISWQENVKCTADYYPISIYSNNNLNKYFDSFISDNCLIQMLVEAEGKKHLKNDIEKLFEDLLPDPEIIPSIDIISKLPISPSEKIALQQIASDNKLELQSKPEEDVLAPLYTIFKSPKTYKKVDNLDNKIKESLGRIYDFHKWFVDENRNSEKLGFLMSEFIRDIGLNDELR